jgi:hypothetical protein
MSSELLSDLERARLKSPGRPDADLVITLAQRTLAELGMNPPVSHEILASLRGIVRVEETDLPWAGCLMMEDGGLVIKLREGDGRGRKRFTAFHEIEHTFMPGFAVIPQYRCDPTIPAAPGQPRKGGLEVLCDLGAVELLLPRRAFRKDLRGNRPTMELAGRLAQRYDASLEATARRIVTLRHSRTLLLALEMARKPSAPQEEPKLRVQWVHPSEGWPFVPPHKSVPSDSLLAIPLSGEPVDVIGTLAGLTDPPLANVLVSAVPSPYTDGKGELHERVLALISPAGPAGDHRAF